MKCANCGHEIIKGDDGFKRGIWKHKPESYNQRKDRWFCNVNFDEPRTIRPCGCTSPIPIEVENAK